MVFYCIYSLKISSYGDTRKKISQRSSVNPSGTSVIVVFTSQLHSSPHCLAVYLALPQKKPHSLNHYIGKLILNCCVSPRSCLAPRQKLLTTTMHNSLNICKPHAFTSDSYYYLTVNLNHNLTCILMAMAHLFTM